VSLEQKVSETTLRTMEWLIRWKVKNVEADGNIERYSTLSYQRFFGWGLPSTVAAANIGSSKVECIEFSLVIVYEARS